MSINDQIKYTQEILNPSDAPENIRLKMTGYVIVGGKYYSHDAIVMQQGLDVDHPDYQFNTNAYKSEISGMILLEIGKIGGVSFLCKYGIENIPEDQKSAAYDWILFNTYIGRKAEDLQMYQDCFYETIDDTYAYKKLYPSMKFLSVELNNYLAKFLEEYSAATTEDDKIFVYIKYNVPEDLRN